MPRASTSPRCASRLARSWFERPTSPRVALSSSASESLAGAVDAVDAVDAVGGAPDVRRDVDNEAAWVRVLGSIHALYTRTFVAPYSSARSRTRARTTSKSSALAKAQPSAEQRNGCTENRTCSSERHERARIAVKREVMKTNARRLAIGVRMRTAPSPFQERPRRAPRLPSLH
jgi:hypothetical protein